MPVLMDSNHLSPKTPGFYEGSSRCITIGLINNMPDAALEATERQFIAMLNAASMNVQIRLSRYMLPEISRQPEARRFLFEDHVHQCVACRHAVELARDGEMQPVWQPKAASRSFPVWRWAMAWCS